MFESPKPSAQAKALVVFFGELLVDGRYFWTMFRRVDTILLFSNVFLHLRRKFIKETVLSFNFSRSWCSCMSTLVIWQFPFTKFVIQPLHKLHSLHPNLTFGNNELAGCDYVSAQELRIDFIWVRQCSSLDLCNETQKEGPYILLVSLWWQHNHMMQKVVGQCSSVYTIYSINCVFNSSGPWLKPRPSSSRAVTHSFGLA